MNQPATVNEQWASGLSDRNAKRERLSRGDVPTILLICSMMLIFGSFVTYELLADHRLGAPAKFQEGLRLVGLGLGLLMFVIAIGIEGQQHDARQRFTKHVQALPSDSQLDGDEPASLEEIDKLLLNQDPYFALQLAHALLQKAKSFPIRVQDIEDMRAILDDREEDRRQNPCPQVIHLTKLIKMLEQNSAA